jgi:hypothetical protein
VLVLHMPRLWLKLVATLRLTGCLALPAVPTCLLPCQPVADGSGRLVPSPGCLPAVSIASCFFMLLPAAADREEESESIMDEEDLDRMAGVAGGAGAAAGEAGAAAREPTPETQLRPAAAVRAACSGCVLLCGTGSGVGHGKGEGCSVVPCLPRAQSLQRSGDLRACLPPVCAAKSLRRAQSGRLPTRSLFCRKRQQQAGRSESHQPLPPSAQESRQQQEQQQEQHQQQQAPRKAQSGRAPAPPGQQARPLRRRPPLLQQGNQRQRRLRLLRVAAL